MITFLLYFIYTNYENWDQGTTVNQVKVENY